MLKYKIPQIVTLTRKIQYKLYKNTLQKRKDATKAPFLIAHL